MAPERIRKWGTQSFFVVPLHFFGSTNTISSFGERLSDGQYSLVTISKMTYYVSGGTINLTRSIVW